MQHGLLPPPPGQQEGAGRALQAECKDQRQGWHRCRQWPGDSARTPLSHPHSLALSSHFEMFYPPSTWTDPASGQQQGAWHRAHTGCGPAAAEAGPWFVRRYCGVFPRVLGRHCTHLAATDGWMLDASHQAGGESKSFLLKSFHWHLIAVHNHGAQCDHLIHVYNM